MGRMKRQEIRMRNEVREQLAKSLRQKTETGQTKLIRNPSPKTSSKVKVCPIFSLAIMIALWSGPEKRANPAAANGECRGERCAMWDERFERCGLVK